MTRFAPPTLIECPHCQAVLAVSRLSSLNFDTFGGLRVWTDGETNNIYANVGADVGVCPQCTTGLWVKDATKLGATPDAPKAMGRWEAFFLKLTGDRKGHLREQLSEQGRWQSIPEGMKNPLPIKSAQLPDLIAMLESPTPLSAEREAHLRRQIWRAGNDHLRRRKDGQPWRASPALNDEQAIENIRALLRLYELQAIANSVERAELLRKLGCFDEALALLDGDDIEHKQSAYFSTVHRLAEARKVEVAELVY